MSAQSLFMFILGIQVKDIWNQAGHCVIGCLYSIDQFHGDIMDGILTKDA